MPAVVREGLDLEWLASAFRADPSAHAFAVWDLEHERDRVRFLSLVGPQGTLAYLLIWLGNPSACEIHWVGAGPEAAALSGRLPPRPFVLIAPEEVVPEIERIRGPVTSSPLLVMTAERTFSASRASSPAIQTVGPEEAPRLRAWAAAHPHPMARSYREYDPARHLAWAAHEGREIVGVASAAVRLPRLWTVNSVFVNESARGRGWGRELARYGQEVAGRAGAATSLYVREGNAPARRIYDRLGFRIRRRLAWIDAGVPAARSGAPSPKS